MAEEQKNRVGKKVVLITLLIILALIITYVVAYFTALKVISKPEENKDSQEKEVIKRGIVYSLGEFLTNLNDKGYIKLQLELEVKDKETAASMENRKAELRNKINAILRSKTKSEVSGKEGMDNLRTTIKVELNRLLGEEVILDVFFTDIIVH